MRVSVDPNDQGFHPRGPQYIVTLNGKVVPHAVTADEELGLVHVGILGEKLRVLQGVVKIASVH